VGTSTSSVRMKSGEPRTHAYRSFNALAETVNGLYKAELINRQGPWRTRVELANAIFEYLEIFHNRQRRHSAPGMLTPIEFETRHQTETVA